MCDDEPKEKGSYEAEEFCPVIFRHALPSGTIKEHNAECGVHILIEGLKEELSGMFDGLPADMQVWEYKGRVLENTKSLNDYGITGSDKRAARIIVTVR